ncbi:MAG: hypothetical protein IJI14_01535 [Anaerolineaceae bacterium]|nr:hypothetical protein [Anaerolineaceae bacterium]
MKTTEKIESIAAIADKIDYIFAIPFLSLDEKLLLNNTSANLFAQKIRSKEKYDSVQLWNNSAYLNESIALDFRKSGDVFVIVEEETGEPFKTSFEHKVRNVGVDLCIASKEPAPLEIICEKLEKNGAYCKPIPINDIITWMRNAVSNYKADGVCLLSNIRGKNYSATLVKEDFFPKNTRLLEAIELHEKESSKERIRKMVQMHLSNAHLFLPVGSITKEKDIEMGYPDYELSEDGSTVTIRVYPDVFFPCFFCVAGIKDIINYGHTFAKNVSAEIVTPFGNCVLSEEDLIC